jgi:polyisoprenoid-binding protein YceI
MAAETITQPQTELQKMVWEIDPSHSKIGFVAKHMVITTVRGQFDRYKATVVFDPRHPESAQVDAEIEAASINTGVEQRDNHLRSADFFDAENYPAITFKSKQLQRVSDDRWKLTGDLNIRGTTREIVLDLEGFSDVIKDPWGGLRIGGSATATVNRFDYGLHWNATIETGGLVVGERIALHLDVELVRKAD